MSTPVAVDTVLDLRDPSAPPDEMVSVTVSLYDYARFLPACLDSVAAQRHQPLELIVVDDASSKDDSVAVARGWLEAHRDRFHRVALLRHRRNQGLAQARNTGFAAARAPCVFVLDADNALYPRAIARLYDTMRCQDVAAAYTQLEYFGAETGLGFADTWDATAFRTANYVDAMALVRKRAWRDVGGYTHLEGGWEDYDFWCKFVEHGLYAAFVPEILCRYRVHPDSMLRTEHLEQSERLVLQMMQRHPWLHIA